MEIKELLSYLHLGEFIVLDLETTGLDPYKDSITEISAYRFKDGLPDSDFSTLINPGVSIPANISEITGITDEMVKDSPAIHTVLLELSEFIGDLPIVGHNIGFDLKFINHQFSMMNYKEIENRTYDTLILSRTFLFFHHDFTLGSISQFFGLGTKDAHRASADTLNTGQIFTQLVHEAASYPLAVIQQLYHTIRHTDMHNLLLFRNLVTLAVELKEVNGLTKSSIAKPDQGFYFNHGTGKKAEISVATPDEWLSENGLIAKNMRGFESRETQKTLANDTYHSFEKGELLLAEAETGLGKSMAYLSAGILHRKKSDIPLVVSTYTKNLQDQLFYKDIPQLANALDIDLTAVLVKGRQNYICLTRLEYLLNNVHTQLNSLECENLLPVLIWKEFTKTGDISDCNGFKMRTGNKLWNLIRSERGYCTTFRCNHNHGCFLGKIRELIKSSDIIIVNHSLHALDFLQEVQSLPDTYNYVIDEGHNFEAAVQDQLTNRISDYSFYDIFNIFLNKSFSLYKDLESICSTMDTAGNQFEEITAFAKKLKSDIHLFFNNYGQQKNSKLDQYPQYELRVIITDSSEEFSEVDPEPESLIEQLIDFKSKIADLIEVLSKSPQLDNIMNQELTLLTEKIDALITNLSRIINTEPEDVVWSTFMRQRDSIQAFLHCAPRSVSEQISSGIISRNTGGLICSGTLTVEDNFDYLKTCLGIDKIEHKKSVIEKIYHSPFSFNDQVRLFVGTGTKSVQSPDYIEDVSLQINKITGEIPGRMLVLCTSYAQT
ncbi:MAG: exonuclease domain-containing protein, partial [Fidelibacterota bacterium]